MNNNPGQSRFTWHGLPAHEYPGHLAPSPRGRAFTLIELMVVIGIVIIVVGLLLVAVSKSMATGRRVRAQADLQSIAIALDAYKADFGDYPRPVIAPDPYFDASHILCRVLVAPGPDTGLGGDGAAGPGFRVRGTQGTVYGPYIDLEKFDVDAGNCVLRSKVYPPTDPAVGVPPIIYIPKNIRPIRPEENYVAANANAMYDTRSIPGTLNWPTFATFGPLSQMQGMMGDKTPNGKIVAPDVPATTAPYILWMPGPDGMFGLTNSKGARDATDGGYATDDIANFIFDPAITVK